MLVKVYELKLNGQAILEISIETSLPIRPRLRMPWLKAMIVRALSLHLSS
jgi:hypothetical protein